MPDMATLLSCLRDCLQDSFAEARWHKANGRGAEAWARYRRGREAVREWERAHTDDQQPREELQL
jgi:hypothetical protein